MRRTLRLSAALCAGFLGPACGSGEGSGGGVIFVPSAPSGVVAYADCTAITLRWDPVPGASGYVLYRATQAGVMPSNYATLPGGTRTPNATNPQRVAPLAPATTYSFVVAAVGDQEGPPSAEVSSTPALPAATPPGPQGTLFTLTGTLRDIVYDPLHDRAYATNESSGRLEILDGTLGALLPPLPLPGTPAGLDLSLDYARLFVCLSNAAAIAVVDLNASPPTIAATVPVPADASGATHPRWIACAGNGRAFFSCVDAGAGYAILRQLDLATLAVTPRVDLNGGQTKDPTYVAASGDRTRLLFGEGTGGAYYYYSTATDSFTGTGTHSTGGFTGIAVNGDGSLFAFVPGPYFAGPDFRQRGSVWVGRSMFAFAPTGNRGYTGYFGTVSPVLYPDFLVEFDPITVPGNVFAGPVKISPSGHALYSVANGGILKVPLTVNRPPRFTSAGSLTVSVGNSAGTTISALDLEGDPIEYCAANLPANASFDPATRRLTFAPSAAQGGQSFSVTMYASDGRSATAVPLSLTAINPPSYPYQQFPVGGSVLGTLGELAYDPARDRLYVASSGGSRIDVIEIATNTQLDPIHVGSGAVGVDLSADSSKLVVCPSNTEFIQVVDLTATPPSVAWIPVPDGPTPDSRFPWNVGVAANNRALFTTSGPTTGAAVYVRDLDLLTGAVTVRGDVPGGTVTSTTLIRSSRDHGRLIFTQSQATPRAMFTYSSATNSFGTIVTRSNPINDVDVNGDGSRFLVAPGAELYDGSLSSLGTFPSSPPDFRVSFRQGSASTAYRFGIFTSAVEILDTGTFAVSGSFTAGYQPRGRMITNNSGTRLFMVLQNGLAVVTLP